MGKGSAHFKTTIRMARIIHTLPDPMNKAYQDCTEDEKVAQLMRLAFKQYSGMTYTEQFYQENKRFFIAFLLFSTLPTNHITYQTFLLAVGSVDFFIIFAKSNGIMFAFKDNTFEKKFRNGEVSPEQLKEHLMRNYSVFDLADALSDYLIEENEFVKNKIVLTNKQTQLIEILMGKIARPVYEGKGRKPKTAKYLEARENIDPTIFTK